MYAGSQDSEAIAGKVGVSPLPKGDGAEDVSAATLGGWQMMVSKYSENQDAAIEFVKYLTSPELQTSFAIERSHLPTIPAVYDDPAVAEASEFIPRLKPVFEAAVGRPSAQTGDLYPELSTIFYQQLNQVLSGSKIRRRRRCLRCKKTWTPSSKATSLGRRSGAHQRTTISRAGREHFRPASTLMRGSYESEHSC